MRRWSWARLWTPRPAKRRAVHLPPDPLRPVTLSPIINTNKDKTNDRPT